MKKILVIALVIVILIISGFFTLNTYIYNEKQGATYDDYKNAGYVIDGKEIILTNGLSEHNIPGTSTSLTTRYFGNEVTGDFNEDGAPDVAFILTQDGGGSGTFYYVVAALRTSKGYRGTNAILLGDRIAPQTTEIKGTRILVNYADRRPQEPFITAPSVGISRYFAIKEGTLVEIVE